MDWQREADELHVFFENYFLGTEMSLDRAEQAFAADFTHVGPTGNESDRRGIMQMLEQGHAHTNSLKIRLSNHRLLAEDSELVVVTFDEHHELTSGQNSRRHTVVFRREPAAPNGLHWLRVQETWLGQDES